MSAIYKNGKEVTVIPEVDIVADNVHDFKAEIFGLLNENINHLIVDMKNVGVVDSSGIGIFIYAQNNLRQTNGKLHVINVSPYILKMFKTMRLDNHFEIEGKK